MPDNGVRFTFRVDGSEPDPVVQELALNTYRNSLAQQSPLPVIALGDNLHLLADAAPSLQNALYWRSKIESRIQDILWYEGYSSTPLDRMTPEHHARAREIEKEVPKYMFRMVIYVGLAKKSLHELFD